MAKVVDAHRKGRYKFRLGDSQSITVRCEPAYDGLKCVARARLGKVTWSASGRCTVDEVETFIAAVQQIVSTLSGSAEFKPRGSFEIRVSVEKVGAIRTDYTAWGAGGALLGTKWQVAGSFVSWHQYYLAVV